MTAEVAENSYIHMISTHTLTWSVTLIECKHLSVERYFNSHAHVERDSIGVNANFNMKHFNSHAHVERDVVTISSALKNGNFNSHAHVERDAITLVNSTSKTHFNSHAHVERDL